MVRMQRGEGRGGCRRQRLLGVVLLLGRLRRFVRAWLQWFLGFS